MKRRFGSPVRSLAFWPPGVGIAAALFVAALAVLSPQGIGKAEAYTITGDGRIVVNASQVQVSLHWYEAEFDNVFGMDSPVPQDIFFCKSEPADVPVDIGIFDAGELIFRLKTPEGNTWLTGPASRNADNFQHAQLTPISDTVIRIGWEDYFGGGDQDFNDCVVDVTIQELPTATPTASSTPAPTATSTPAATPTGTHTPLPTDTPAATATETETSHKRKHTSTPTAMATETVEKTPVPASAPIREVLSAVTTRQSPPQAQALPKAGVAEERETNWATLAGVLSWLLGSLLALGGLRLRRRIR
jgi:hypothetical protein